MKRVVVIFFIIAISQFVYTQVLNEAEISGKILNLTEKSLKIGNNEVPVSSNGDFIFRTNIEFPCFLDINYDDLYGAIYLEPGKTVELEIKTDELSDLIYNGDLKFPNEYLKKIIPKNKEISEFLNNNWYPVHTKNESEFISIIDSLKGLFLDPLAENQNKQKHLPDNFIKLFEADVNYGLNSLIIHYPEVHFKITGEKTSLSQRSIDYINSFTIDEIRFIDLQSYKSYCRKWIDYNADILIVQNREHKQYNLKKMDILFEFLPEVFKNQRLLDYWLSEYLNEHIENTWLANSKKYVEAFDKMCKTEVYKAKINDLYTSYSDSERDHVVKIFKTVGGYKLEAHIFYPDNLNNNEKRPAIVIYHGGGFVLGNPSWAFDKAKKYADKGMIAISAQYRLSNFRDITPLDAIQDAKDLMIWLRENADSLKIINDKIAVSGWSVGGQLCATLAVFVDTLSDLKINTSPNALLLTSPGTGTGGWFTELLNGADVNPADFSPADHIRKGLPPTIILQGRDDTVTPLEDVQLFHDRLVAYDNYCEIWIYDNVGHLFTPTSLGDNGWPRPDTEVQKQADLRAEEFLTKFGFIK
jgi:acetyl esterase